MAGKLVNPKNKCFEELEVKVPTKTSELTNDSDFINSQDLARGLAGKQNTLRAGNNITISNNVISAKSGVSILQSRYIMNYEQITPLEVTVMTGGAYVRPSGYTMLGFLTESSGQPNVVANFYHVDGVVHLLLENHSHYYLNGTAVGNIIWAKWD